MTGILQITGFFLLAVSLNTTPPETTATNQIITTPQVELIIHTPPPPQDYINRLLTKLEGQLAQVNRQFGTWNTPPVKVRLTASLDEYRQRCRAVWPSGGSYLPYEDEVCLPPINQLNQLNSLESLLRHELTHARIHHQLAACPLWVEEYFALLAGNYNSQKCDKNAQTRCPTNQELLYPKTKQQAEQNYCQIYFCGQQFITSQKLQDVSNSCLHFSGM